MVLGGEKLEAIVLVEVLNGLVLSVGDDGEGRNLTRSAKRPSQCIQEEASTDSLALVVLVDRQAADERGGIEVIPSNAVGELGWEDDPLDSDRAQRVEAGDPVRLAVVEDPDGGDPLLHLPASPLLQVPVQCLLPAGEGAPERQMLLSERLEAVPLLHGLVPDGVPKLSCQCSQVLVRLRRIDKRLNKDATSLSRQLYDVVRPDGFSCCGKRGAADKVRRIAAG